MTNMYTENATGRIVLAHQYSVPPTSKVMEATPKEEQWAITDQTLGAFPIYQRYTMTPRKADLVCQVPVINGKRILRPGEWVVVKDDILWTEVYTDLQFKRFFTKHTPPSPAPETATPEAPAPEAPATPNPTPPPTP